MMSVQNVLKSHGIKVKVISSASNEVADIFWVTSSAKLSQIKTLEDDLAYKMGYALVRVYPDPVKRAIVIEAHRLQDKKIERNEKELSKLTDYKVAFGMSPFEVIVHDFVKDPHLLIAGTTGSGKSTALHNIVSHLVKYNPNTFVLPIDFKGTELDIYKNFVPTAFNIDPDTFGSYYGYAAHLLEEAVRLMNVRYEMLQEREYKDLAEYNEKESDKMTRVFVVIDELADLMLGSKKEAEEAEKNIVLLAQKARAAGIHLIISTQRPTVDVLTGHIKANISTRVSLRTSTAMESRIILDENGAECLKVGGMIYLSAKGLVAGKSFFFEKAQAKKEILSIEVVDDVSFSFYQQKKDESLYQKIAELDYGDGPLAARVREYLDLMGGKVNAWDLMLEAFRGKNPYMYIAQTMFVLKHLEAQGEIKMTKDIGKATKYFTQSDMEGTTVEWAPQDQVTFDGAKFETDEEAVDKEIDNLSTVTKASILVQSISKLLGTKTK